MINLLEHLTDASSEWSQLWTPIPLWLQSNNSDSDPVQNTSSNQISPVPCPKWANERAVPVRIELSNPPFATWFQPTTIFSQCL